MREMKLLTMALAAMCLSACSTVNDGSSELRYHHSNRFEVLRPDADQQLGVADNFSISLHKAFIKNFQEWPVSTNATLTGKGFTRHGEIAVLVKATEAGSDKPVRPKDPGKEFDGHRLIYYSDDVYPDQFLQFSMAPLWGPGKVASGALKLEFVILELDRTSVQTEQLLTNLAEIGRSQAALTGPLAGALLSLGQTLITSANDDRQMRFEVVFDFDATGPNPLRTGQYFLVRRENRQEAIGWNAICASRGDGLLYKKPATGACDTGELLRSDTYLSLVVAPRPVETKAFAAETYADLTAQLEGEVNPTFTEVQAIVGAYATGAAERQNHGNLLTAWRQIELATAGLADAQVARPNTVGATCAKLPATDAAVATASTLLSVRIQKFVSDLERMKSYAAAKAANPVDPNLKIKDAISTSDFQAVGRTALLYVGNSNAAAVANTLDISKVGASGLFDANLEKTLQAKAGVLAADAVARNACRSAV